MPLTDTNGWAQFCSKRDSKSTVIGAVTLLLTGHFVLTRSQAQLCSTHYCKSTVVGAVTLLLKPFCFNTFSGTTLQYTLL